MFRIWADKVQFHTGVVLEGCFIISQAYTQLVQLMQAPGIITSALRCEAFTGFPPPVYSWFL